MTDWESYWRGITRTGVNGQVFWDVDPELASLEDLNRFRHYMNPDLPLLDLGCGNGRQSRFLSRFFPRVIGVDLSSSAIELAKSEARSEANTEFRVLDGIHPEEAIGLHNEIDDTNVYMRGVFHMIPWTDRSRFVDSLKVLLGGRGTLYQIELCTSAILHLRSLSTEVFAQIPKVTKRVGFSLEDRPRFYPDQDWVVLDQGADVVVRSIPLPDGRVEPMPANYLILRRKI
jgi:SAM-dependent methyltransferase